MYHLLIQQERALKRSENEVGCSASTFAAYSNKNKGQGRGYGVIEIAEQEEEEGFNMTSYCTTCLSNNSHYHQSFNEMPNMLQDWTFRTILKRSGNFAYVVGIVVDTNNYEGTDDGVLIWMLLTSISRHMKVICQS